MASKCSACDSPATFIGLIPRWTSRNKVRVPVDPARFSLCTFHADTLAWSDPTATFTPITGAPVVASSGRHFDDYDKDEQ